MQKDDLPYNCTKTHQMFKNLHDINFQSMDVMNENLVNEVVSPKARIQPHLTHVSFLQLILSFA